MPYPPQLGRLLACVATFTVVVGGSIALGPTASGAPGNAAKKPMPRAYQYGNWTQPGSGFLKDSDDTLSQVYQLASRSSFPDLAGTPGPIFAAGTFVKSGSTTINRVGMWDDTASAWVPLPGDDTGIAFGVGQSLTAGGYAAPGVYGLVLGGDDSLYAGGSFATSDDSLNNVGQWNGTNWIPLGNGLKAGNGTAEVVQDMVMGNDFIGMDDTRYADDTVYAIGGFDGTCATLACTSLGRNAAGIAQYSQSDDTWYPMGDGTISQRTGSGKNDQIYAGAQIDDTLYVGGNFLTLGGANVSGVAQWSTSAAAWLPIGLGINVSGTWDGVFSMAVNPITKDLYVGGLFNGPVGSSLAGSPGIVKWDYTDDTWYSVGTGMTSGNVDDIAFSADGKTMWIGNWATAPTVGGTTANGIATLTSEDFDDTAATTISGSWGYLKSAGVIGVTGPANNSINQSSTRAVLAMPGGAMMAGGNFKTAGPVAAGRVALFTPGAEPSPYDPVYPAGVPTTVVATPGWRQVTVDWTAPAYSGSYPITNYLVQASPSGQVCITRLTDPKLNQCTFTALTPGTKYTFTVQALNGAGWGNRSAASNMASPYDLKITSYKREKLGFFQGSGSKVTASGSSGGYPAGTRITPWLMFANSGVWEEQRNSGLTADANGRFSWQRKFGKDKNSKTISVKFSVAGNESNTISMGPVR